MTFSVLEWVREQYRVVRQSSLPVGQFLRSTLSALTSTSNLLNKTLPCPVVYSWWEEPPALATRRHLQEWKLRRAAELLTNLAIVSVNQTPAPVRKLDEPVIDCYGVGLS